MDSSILSWATINIRYLRTGPDSLRDALGAGWMPNHFAGAAVGRLIYIRQCLACAYFQGRDSIVEVKADQRRPAGIWVE